MLANVTVAALLACLASLGGCHSAPATAAAERSPLPPPADFAIAFKRGGGFTGSTESLVVRPGLHAVATSTGTGIHYQKVEFPISSEKVRALRAGLRRAHFGSIEDKPEQGYCADCFTYAISYRGRRLRFVDPDVPPRLEDVIGELRAVIAGHTIPNA